MRYFSVERIWESVLAIPGILSEPLPPRVIFVLGSAWKKQTKNGLTYYKVKFDAFGTPAGKALYGKLWPSKFETGVFNMYVRKEDMPLVSQYPHMVNSGNWPAYQCGGLSLKIDI